VGPPSGQSLKANAFFHYQALTRATRKRIPVQDLRSSSGAGLFRQPRWVAPRAAWISEAATATCAKADPFYPNAARPFESQIRTSGAICRAFGPGASFKKAKDMCSGRSEIQGIRDFWGLETAVPSRYRRKWPAKPRAAGAMMRGHIRVPPLPNGIQGVVKDPR